MILIAHRGNIYGKNTKYENHPDYIKQALHKNYDVEIDVWYKDGKFILGHDKPLYNIEKSFLQNKKIWCHAKNIQGLQQLLDINAHCFYHIDDDVTLTSKGYIWTMPGYDLTNKSICVLPEKTIKNRSDHSLPNQNNPCYGICSDIIGKYQ